MGKTCFVIMPYGVKQDCHGNRIDFDTIYRDLISKAVDGIEGLDCLRCDDIEEAGWIHERMIRQICTADVAVVDLSIWNANVYYELGVRHALRKAVTVLIQNKGAQAVFNLVGMSSIHYETTPEGTQKAIQAIRAYIVNGMRDPDTIDSLVFKTIPELGPSRRPKAITQHQVFNYAIGGRDDISLGFVTGDYEEITECDVWVNSENTNMLMDLWYGRSTSATIRYLGARRSFAGIEEDTVNEALKAQLATAFPELNDNPNAVVRVPAGTVIPAGSGALADTNNVKQIFHVASVVGQARHGYKTIDNPGICVKNVLREFKAQTGKGAGLASIMLPVFGTGPAGGDFSEHLRMYMNAAIEIMGAPGFPPCRAYFYVWGDLHLVEALKLAAVDPRLRDVAA